MTSKTTGKIDSDRFDQVWSGLGGEGAMVMDEYVEHLYKNASEVLEKFRELKGLLRALKEARKNLKGSQEAMGGQVERLGPEQVLSKIDRALIMLTRFATGGKIGKMATAKASQNPLLGGLRPALPETSFPIKTAQGVRRIGTGLGAGSTAFD